MAALTSIHNPLIRSVRKAVQRGSLTDDGLCVAEGFHLLEEALRSGCEVPAVLTTETARAVVEKHLKRLPSTRVHTVSDSAFREVSTTETPQGVITLVRPPAWTVEHVLRGQALTVVLDGIQEPGNAGAIARTAEGFGATGIVFLKGTVDPYNPKCVRGSAGSVFRLPILYGADDDVFWAAAEQRGVGVLAAMPAGGLDLFVADFTGRCAVVIGAEGRGVRPEIARKAMPVRIPTVAVESLNAAVAAGVLLYEARRQRMQHS